MDVKNDTVTISVSERKNQFYRVESLEFCRAHTRRVNEGSMSSSTIDDMQETVLMVRDFALM